MSGKGKKRALAAAAMAVLLCACGERNTSRLDAAEPLLADYLDAAGAIDMLGSGVQPTFDDASLEVWQGRYVEREAALRSALERVSAEGLNAQDRRRFESMRSALALRAADTGAAPRCEDVSTASAGPALRAALYVCFDAAADIIAYRGEQVGRIGALDLMESLASGAERRAAFEAMTPLYEAVHPGGPDSPYIRIMHLENARMRANIEGSVQSLGLSAAEGEAWLERALTQWSERLPYAQAEPWDFRRAMSGSVDPALATCAQASVQMEANARFYRELGADFDALGMIMDTSSGAPVAYADFVRVGRNIEGAWRPAVPWITLVVADGGPDAAAELVHEVGHAAHYAAMRARPSLTLPDDLSLLLEATADITGWSVSEPAWQRRYVGCAYPEAASLRAKLAPIMLDMAWGLFEMRMARDPAADPNVLWGEIAERYFRVRRHDDIAWWAVRGQLVEEPGYMVNYALGAFVTADLRARIREEIGDFDTGNPRWYEYVSRNLYVYGGEETPRALLRRFLGRDVQADAFLAELARLRPSE